jgi:hypothetical protein
MRYVLLLMCLLLVGCVTMTETIKPWEENIKPGVACFDLYPVQMYAFAGEYCLDYLTSTFDESFTLNVSIYHKGMCGIPDNYKCPEHQSYTRTVKQYDDGENTCPTCSAPLKGGQIDSVCSPYDSELSMTAVPKAEGTGDWLRYADEGYWRYRQEPTATNMLDGIRSAFAAPATGVIHISPLYRQAGWRNAEDEWISQEDYDELSEQEKEAYTNQDGSDGLSLGDEEWDGIVTISAGTGTQEGVEWRLANGNAPTSMFVKVLTASANFGAVTGTGLLMVNPEVVEFNYGWGVGQELVQDYPTCAEARDAIETWIGTGVPTLTATNPQVSIWLAQTAGYTVGGYTYYDWRAGDSGESYDIANVNLIGYAVSYSIFLVRKDKYTMTFYDLSLLEVISQTEQDEVIIEKSLDEFGGSIYEIEHDYFPSTQVPACPGENVGVVSTNTTKLYAVIFPIEEVE